FQAEDGIRDKLVTGVQTCALPIYAPQLTYSGRLPKTTLSPRRLRLFFYPTVRLAQRAWGVSTRWIAARCGLTHGPEASAPRWSRSEERRVGKECRSWWWSYCYDG